MKSKYRFCLPWFTIPLFFLISLLLFECKRKQTAQQAKIDVDLKETRSFLERKTLYLVDVFNMKVLDSTVVRDGRCKFDVKLSDNYTPIPVQIRYLTGNPNRPEHMISYLNPFHERTYESSFYLEPGISNLIRNLSYQPAGMSKLTLLFTDMGLQTTAAYKHLQLRVQKINSPSYTEYNRLLIRQYPYSADLLQTLAYNKDSFNDAALADLLSHFDSDLHHSSIYKDLQGYVKFTNKTGSDFPNVITLKRPNNTRTSYVLTPAKYNLVVFWASWCGPCRREIPQMKELYNTYKDKLAISSISIDKRSDQWQRAMAIENMPWQQYLLNRDTSFVKLDKKYTLSAIPVWLLFDLNNKLIDKGIGQGTGSEGIDRQVAAHFIKSEKK